MSLTSDGLDVESAAFWADVAQRSKRQGNWRLIDADTHVGHSLKPLMPHMEGPWRRQVEVQLGGGEHYLLPFDLGDETVGDRIKRSLHGDDIATLEAARAALGAERSIVFPHDLLGLGLHPNHDMEAAIARGYARWMTDEVLPAHPGLGAMLYLPFGDPRACLELIAECGERPGVAGCFVTSIRHQTVQDNAYMKVYAALEERGLPLAFHPAPFWRDKQFDIFSQMLSAYAVSVPLYNMVHLLNLVLHGIPERFPRLRLLFCEAGVAWLTFVMYRVDMEFLKRPSEAPLLKRKPSEYMRDIFFTSQPLEVADERRLAGLLRMVRAGHHLVFASNAPCWDFDLPSRILEAPGLTVADRQGILYGNAARLFRPGGTGAAAAQDDARRERERIG